MKHILTNLCLLAGISFGTSAFAQTATFDNATRYLTMPSVQVGTTVYSNVVVRLDSFAIIYVGSETPVSSSLPTTCVTTNFTTAKYNAIALGMTPDQVSQTIGCKFNPAFNTRSQSHLLITWANSYSSMIQVYFDPAGTMVTGLLGSDIFKSASGF